ncbi:MAG: tetratricopeptide repeat protein [Pirellulales bacterium]
MCRPWLSCALLGACLSGWTVPAWAQVSLPLEKPGPARFGSSMHRPNQPGSLKLEPHHEANGPRTEGDGASAFSWFSYTFGDGRGGRGQAAGYSAYRRWSESTLPGETNATAGDAGEKAHSLGIEAPTISTAVAARCEKAIMQGDALFAQRKYLPAVERYRAASRVAPTLAKPHMRAGLALVAQGNFEGAVRAFRRGLELQGTAGDDRVALREICGAGPLAETDRTLANRLQATPLNGNLLASMGMQLYFSGQHDRAAPYLMQAAGLGVLDADQVEAFLARAP